MNSEMIVRIKIISKPASYWTTNDPIIPLGQGAHVTGTPSSTIRVGDGKTKYSALSDVHIDSYVAPHAGKHAPTGTDPLVTSDAEFTAGTATDKSPSAKQIKNALAALDAKITSTAATIVSTRPDIVTSAGTPTGTGTPNQLWFQYIA